MSPITTTTAGRRRGAAWTVLPRGGDVGLSLDALAYALFCTANETINEYEDSTPPIAPFEDTPAWAALQVLTQCYWRERAARFADLDYGPPPERDRGFTPVAVREPVRESIGATDTPMGVFGDLFINAVDPALAVAVRDVVNARGQLGRCTHRLPPRCPRCGEPGVVALCSVCHRDGPDAGVVALGDHYVAFVWTYEAVAEGRADDASECGRQP